MAGTRPPKFGPGETCELCIYFSRGYCKKYHWTVDHADWCSEYKAKPSHLAAFKQKESEERKKKLI